MKVLALRLCEIGPFAQGVALEGLSGGLDVLTGPNELGKSTLFKALAILIGKEHTSRHRDIEALRPDSGGAPLIEADLAVGGEVWRVRKRYLTQRSAVLSQLDSGKIWRGADAERQLQALMGSPERDPLRSLVWVSQGNSFWLPDDQEKLGGSLAQLIEYEAVEATGSGLQRRVREEVARRLGELITARTGKVRAGGALDRAQREHAGAAQRLEAARAVAAATAERADRLASLVAERERLAAADAKVLPDRLVAARSALAEADKARERLRTVEERVAGRRLVADRALRLAETFDRAAAEHDALVAALEPMRADREQVAGQREEHRELLEALQSDRDEACSDLDAQRRLLGEARRRADHAAAVETAKIARRQAEDAARLAADVGRLSDELAAMPVNEALVAEVRRYTSSIEVLDARIDSALPRFTIAYAEGAEGRVRVDGRPVAGGEPMVVDRPTILQLEGIGEIRIDPAAGESADAIAERAAARAELAGLLRRMQVADLAAAEARLAERQSLERELSFARAKLEAVGNGDVEALRRNAEVARQRERALAAVAHDGVETELPGRDEIEAQCRELELRIARLDSDIAAARGAVGGAAERLATLDAEIKSAAARLLRLGEEHPELSDREAERERLVAAVTAAEVELGEAIRERSAWAEAAPQGADYEALKAAVATAEAGVAALDARRKVLERSIAELDGALRRDGEDGIGSDVGALEEEVAEAAARLADCQQELAALSLLAQKLDAAAEAHRRDVLMPVVSRLQPYLSQLIGNGRLTLDGPLALAALERNGRRESVSRLSDGTREQIATLVRVTYAELMADRGVELPLVLDDALVFSDDDRMHAMLGVLATAARRHQVIVLSCRERLWDALLAADAGKSAHRLGLATWSGEEMPLRLAS